MNVYARVNYNYASSINSNANVILDYHPIFNELERESEPDCRKERE